MALSLSDRCLQIAPSLTLSIDARAKEMAAQGIDVIGFGAGEPDFNTPTYICDAARRALEQGLTRYTPVAGTIYLREEIAKKLKNDNGLTYGLNEILVSNGAKHSLFNAMSAIINPGDEVLIPAPCWVSYPEMVRMVGGVPVLVYCKNPGSMLVTADELAEHVTEKTKALILNSPNNPNGCVWPRELLKDIARLAVEKGFYVISDEIYEKLIYDGREHVSIASLGDDIRGQTILVNGVSKTYAMTGWRIGYTAAPAPITKAMTSFQSHATSNANSIAQYAAAEALTNGDTEIRRMVAVFSERRLLMHRLINQVDGLSAQLPHGAFYLMADVSGVFGKRFGDREITDTMSFADILLEDKNVAVVPGIAFGSDRHVRLSYAVSNDKIERGIRRIREFVSELR